MVSKYVTSCVILIEQNVQALYYRELAAQLSTLKDNAITSNAIHLLYSTN